jgi:hypothetical protein
LVYKHAISRAGVGHHSGSPSGAVWNAVWSRRQARIMHNRGASSNFAPHAGLDYWQSIELAHVSSSLYCLVSLF